MMSEAKAAKSKHAQYYKKEFPLQNNLFEFLLQKKLLIFLNVYVYVHIYIYINYPLSINLQQQTRTS